MEVLKFKKKKPRRINAKYLENSAAFYLGKYSSSVSNLRRVMKRKINKSCKFYDEDKDKKYELLEIVIEKFIRLGYLDDQRYSKNKVNSFRRSGNSKRKISYKLQLKGIEENLISKTIEQVDAELFDNVEDCELETAKIYVKKKRFGKYRTKDKDEKTDQKELASLARSGFSYEIARKALKDE